MRAEFERAIAGDARMAQFPLGRKENQPNSYADPRTFLLYLGYMMGIADRDKVAEQVLEAL